MHSPGAGRDGSEVEIPCGSWRLSVVLPAITFAFAQIGVHDPPIQPPFVLIISWDMTASAIKAKRNMIHV